MLKISIFDVNFKIMNSIIQILLPDASDLKHSRIWNTVESLVKVGEVLSKKYELDHPNVLTRSLQIIFILSLTRNYLAFMMTSSNGNIFRVTGHLCGEFTGPRWIPRKKDSDVELLFSVICVWINGWVNNCEAGDLRRYCAHHDVTVMFKATFRSCCSGQVP